MAKKKTGAKKSVEKSAKGTTAIQDLKPAKHTAITKNVSVPLYDYDVIFYDTIGNAFTRESLKKKPSGAAEIAIVKYAHWIADRGYSVLVMNGVRWPSEDAGVTYDNHNVNGGLTCRALVISRYSQIPNIEAERTIVWSVDASPQSHMHQKHLFENGLATLVCLSPWHASLFPRTWPIEIIPSALPDSVYEPSKLKRDPNVFVYCSAALKGLTATLDTWSAIRSRHPEMVKAELHITTPGYDKPDLNHIARTPGARYLGDLQSDKVERLLRASAGMFFVNTFPETFCLAAVLAEAVGCRTHILVGAEAGAIPWTVRSPLVTSDAGEFEKEFVDYYTADPNIQDLYFTKHPGLLVKPHDFRMSTIMPKWLEVLGLEDAKIKRDALTVLRSGGTEPVKPPKQTICLVMIVSEKTTAEALRRCVDSVRSIITCGCVVVDPDSKQHTSIEAAFESRSDSTYLKIFEEPWVDFGRNRTKAIEHARGLAEYNLMLDADDWLECAPWFEMPELHHDHYDLLIRDIGIEYWRSFFFRNDSDYYFAGAMHEHLTKRTTSGYAPKLHGIYYHRNASGTDIKRHEAAIASLSKGNDPRSVFYLAQELKDSGRWRESIEKYELRASMGAWTEEVFWSLFQVGRLHQALQSPASVVEACYGKAVDYSPERSPEPLNDLAWYFLEKQDYAKAYQYAKQGLGKKFPGAELLFIDRNVYEWRLKDACAIAACWLGKHEQAKILNEELLADGFLPEFQRPRVEENLNFSLRALKLPVRTEYAAPPISPERIRVFADFLNRMTTIDIPKTASEHWAGRCQGILESSITKPLVDFLVWSDDVEMHEYNDSFKLWHAELKANKQWSRWQKLSRKTKERHHPLSVDAGASPITVQHAYHLKTFEEWTGTRFLDGVDVVVEVGGGYGNFARMLRLDGFQGRHIIIDLPHVREIQQLFQDLTGGSATLTTEEEMKWESQPSWGKKIAFVATWSLSETPMAFREKLFPKLHKRCVKYLIASQWTYDWFGNDNKTYFEQFQKDAGGTWVVRPVPHHETESYLFGVK
jgi:tetratricopeptide (TPR) repeat protein